MSSDGEYEYEYDDEEDDYVLEGDDDTMDWNPMAGGGASSDNPNAAPTMAGKHRV